MNLVYWLLFPLSVIFFACNIQEETANTVSKTDLSSYFDTTGYDDILTGGVNMIPIETSNGTYRVWTKRTGNNPRMKVLLLHGGPGMTHEYLEAFDSWFPREGIEYYYYDQLDSHNSDQPGDSTLWTLPRYVEEVEQVRKFLGLNKENFYLYGHSWGGILALEYALKYQNHLKGLIISNMMSSIPAYTKYAHEVLGPALGDDVFKELMTMEANEDFSNPRYEELIYSRYYPEHVLRMPIEEWPEPLLRSMKHINGRMYVYMQGHSEFGITKGAFLSTWDRSTDLGNITVPTLTIGGTYDTMDPEHKKWMASQVQNGRYLHCPDGSHCAMYDDQETFFKGLITFIRDVDKGIM